MNKKPDVKIRLDQDWDGHPTAQVYSGETAISRLFGVPFPVIQAKIWGLFHGYGWLAT